MDVTQLSAPDVQPASGSRCATCQPLYLAYLYRVGIEFDATAAAVGDFLACPVNCDLKRVGETWNQLKLAKCIAERSCAVNSRYALPSPDLPAAHAEVAASDRQELLHECRRTPSAPSAALSGEKERGDWRGAECRGQRVGVRSWPESRSGL